MTKNTLNEQLVLVITRSKFESLQTHFDMEKNLAKSGDDEVLLLFKNLILREGFYPRRSVAEEDESLLQVIPYVTISEKGRKRALAEIRKGGDPRLEGKTSIGFGGHIEPLDCLDPIAACARRELREELGYIPSLKEEELRKAWRGFLYTPLAQEKVSRVHLGLSLVLELDIDTLEYCVLPRNPEEKPKLLTMKELRDNESNLELWSKIVLNSYL